ncbi:hypothetical protein [Natrinema salsiterrestre]|uniref:DUF8159 domain-containing protein n=1 Tax=Natrinema salsiterrestre TaxID=2950540 RepID=A0A9Q4L0Y8_9EURY|nr:hypothetical protein [Natrinema salsiterrestre]MDF9746091.1 hypothetical protein [Natrinema salsiterrestre]
MTDDSPNGSAGISSRRRFLCAAGTAGTAVTAGCAGSILGTSESDENEIEPEEPSEPRAGTPGEFYTLVERNDIPVESLRWDGSDMVLKYVSDAETEAESKEEIEIITTVYNENLVKHDAGVGTLFAEITNPFEEQAHGWGVKTEWCERYNAAVEDSEGESDDGTSSDGDGDSSAGNETDGDGSDGGNETDSENSTTETEGGNSTDETDGDGGSADMAAVVLISNVLNTRVYAEDLEE